MSRTTMAALTARAQGFVVIDPTDPLDVSRLAAATGTTPALARLALSELVEPAAQPAQVEGQEALT